MLAPVATGATTFRPRIGRLLGLIPANPNQVVAAGPLQPVNYLGGKTMSGGVTVHTIFWTGGTRPFFGQPSGAPHDYVGMIQQFFGDIAHDSTGASGGACTPSSCNSFTVLPQFGEGTSPGHVTPGEYSISYDPTSDSLLDLRWRSS